MARLASWLVALSFVASPALAADVTVQLDSGSGFSVRNSSGEFERLRVDETTGNISRNGALFVHTTGVNNTFVGDQAGNLSTAGIRDTAFGKRALLGNTTGNHNSAFGYNALSSNSTAHGNSAFGSFVLQTTTTGAYNSAFGMFALLRNFAGSHNSAFGMRALEENLGGTYNSAFGYNALRLNTTGIQNLALGKDAGLNQTTGSSNIYLANSGVAAESGQIKIGTVGTHIQATIAGIHGRTSAGGIAVLVNASGVLGTTTSSARFKQDVRDMGDASDLLMRLRPVVFRYTEEAVGAEESKTTQYGLIAEEVAAVAPELVAPDLEGRPYSVKYHELPALLLGEVQAQRRTIARLEARLEELEKRPLYTATPEVAR